MSSATLSPRPTPADERCEARRLARSANEPHVMVRSPQTNAGRSGTSAATADQTAAKLHPGTTSNLEPSEPEPVERERTAASRVSRGGVSETVEQERP